MRGEILAFHREHRLTTLYVTHDLADAIALGDRMAVMRAGSFDQVGTTEELMQHPANDYVADFFAASGFGPAGARDLRRNL